MGDDSNWIAKVASALAHEHSSMTLLINGGAISLHQDVPNSLEDNRPILVMNETGRAADRLAKAVLDKNSDPELHDLVNSGLIYTIDLRTGRDALQSALEKVFGTTTQLFG